MFKSFFPKPGPFFMSAFVWALIAVIFWQAGGGDWVARLVGASDEVPISAARFWSLDYLIFYAYYLICVVYLQRSGSSIARTAGSIGRYLAPRSLFLSPGFWWRLALRLTPGTRRSMI